MANTTINQLSSLAGSALSDVDLFLVHDVSAGIEKQITAADIRTGMGIKSIVIDVSSADDALRVTQRGTGAALRIEDSASPDASPFIVTNTGDLLVGHDTQIQTDNDSGTLFNPKHQIHGANEAGSSLALYSWNSNPSIGPHFVFSKSSSSTIGTRTVVTSGTDLGGIVFAGDDGVGFTIAAEILAEVDGSAAVGDMPGRIVFLTTGDGANTASERMRITSSGNVGIATTAPTQKLDVNDSSIRIRTSNTPASADAPGTQGQVAWDADYVYVCVAANTWKRAALSTW